MPGPELGPRGVTPEPESPASHTPPLHVPPLLETTDEGRKEDESGLPGKYAQNSYLPGLVLRTEFRRMDEARPLLWGSLQPSQQDGHTDPFTDEQQKLEASVN